MVTLANGHGYWPEKAPKTISAAHRTQHEYRKNVLFGKSPGARAEPIGTATVRTAELLEVVLPVVSAREPVQGSTSGFRRSGRKTILTQL